MHTHELLSIAAAIVPERTAISFDGRETTYAGLAERSNRPPHALAGLGGGAATGALRGRVRPARRAGLDGARRASAGGADMPRAGAVGRERRLAASLGG